MEISRLVGELTTKKTEVASLTSSLEEFKNLNSNESLIKQKQSCSNCKKIIENNKELVLAKLEEIEDLENTLSQVRATHKKELEELEEETNRLKVSRFIWKLFFDRTTFSLHFLKLRCQNIS